ncbi:diacylglycerol/lipid kinase family protein [Sphingomonas sp.]|uniref:diacylglycerol/lipid kinase family protein n=1 Tax=Sphingomonas sp. TaxID=28214 RepID=UPI002BED81FA|nr:diacylglycerol kinase family protein [Sphingomonas sp.]HWK36695.1 diacylglycerol kinase family protein [Sphingomonas sp.]
MQTLWFITNPNSGTATPQKCEALEAVFHDHGLILAGRTHFPDDDLPDGAALDRAGIDTVVLFAGDGTINAALCALADWDGGFLILPGGTMNLLAKGLHDSLDPATIIAAARDRHQRVALPYIEAGDRRAFVGLIIGPAASWFRAREQARSGSIGGIWRAAGAAWRRTFGRGVRVAGAPGLRSRYQAVMVRPDARQGLDVAGIDARDWRAIADLGWTWVTGDWVAARAVDQTPTDRLSVLGRKPVLALFDGEPQQLEPAAAITGSVSRKVFLSTKSAP